MTSFLGNAAGSLGGAVAIQSSLAFNITGCTFAANSIHPFLVFGVLGASVGWGASPLNVELQGGGGVYAEISKVNFASSTFDRNAVWFGGRGGAVRSVYSTLSGSSLTITGNRFVTFFLGCD